MVTPSMEKVTVALPQKLEDGLSVLQWVFTNFPRDKTKIILTHVITSPYDDESESKAGLLLSQYFWWCESYEFYADTFVHPADNIAEGIVQVIANCGVKNLVMASAANRDMTDLASKTAKQVRREANLSCKLWFVSEGNLIFTREMNSNSLKPAPTSHERNHQNRESAAESTRKSARSNSESTTEKEKHAKKLELKDQEIRELKETLQRQKQEMDKLRQEIEQVKTENDDLRRQSNEYSNQIKVANENRLELDKQVSDYEVTMGVISASAGEQINSLEAKLYHMQLEKDSNLLNSEFSLQELEQATENFSESLRIGEGGFGPVYKGSLRQTTVAIKLLHSQSRQGISEFQQEITILTKVRHPNLVTLIGSCSEVSALVYEYLSNGSLEDRLTCANNTPPLTWQTRIRIIGEICLALIFLHSNKPQLVVHRDLNPRNILLDTNMVSKISDFGLSRLLKQPDTNSTASLQTSSPVGTFPYIDPEYSSTGTITPKSDIYSFGIIILRILTGQNPLGIVRKVKKAMRDERLLSVIDKSAGSWPLEQAKKLANIAIDCTKSRSERCNDVKQVWAVIKPLMEDFSHSHGSELGEESIPAHFICPIEQEIMKDPHFAADGFTYEKKAIRRWFRNGNNTSPLTNLELEHQRLTPNFNLRSAIQEWLERHPQH